MGKSGQRKPSYITFSQDLVPDYWPGWEPALIESGDVRAIGEEILRRYEVAAGGEAAGFWIIKHDQDLDAEGNPASIMFTSSSIRVRASCTASRLTRRWV